MTAPALSRQPGSRVRLISSQATARPRVAAWVVYTLVVAIVFFGLIYSQTALDGSAFELRELEDQIDLAEQQQLELRLEVARLSSPSRIVPAANDLGMVLPTDMRTISAPGVVVRSADAPLSDPTVTASP